MIGKKVIRGVDLPTRLPLSFSMITWLMMDRLDASPIWMGVYWTLLTLIWIASTIAFFTQVDKPVVFGEEE